MNTLSSITRLAPGKRHSCPFCDDGDSGKSFSVRDGGESGYYKCFACGAKGDGVGLLVHAYGYSFADALAAFGIQRHSTPLLQSVKQRRRRAQIRRNEAPDVLLEWCRVRRQMTELERTMAMAYGALPPRPSAHDMEQAAALLDLHIKTVLARTHSERFAVNEEREASLQPASPQPTN